MRAMRLNEATVRNAHFGGKLGRVRFDDYCGGGRRVGMEPSAFLVTLLDPGSRIDGHFHDVDQFQVSVRGDGRIGAHGMNAVTVHYADAYAPYGPIVPGPGGLSFFTLRNVGAGGTWNMPDGRAAMPPGRPLRPRRNFVTGLPDATHAPLAGEVQTVTLVAANEDGLAVTAMRLGAAASAVAPAPESGQYIVVCAGALQHPTGPLAAEALLLTQPGDDAALLRAGEEGATVLVLQFPRPTERPGSNPAQLASRGSDYVNAWSYTEDI